MRFVLMHGSIVEHDAIGSDIVGMYDLLAKSHECRLYGEFVEVAGRNIMTRAELERFLTDPENVVIYHHSVYWEDGGTLLSLAKARLVFKYHNITPPDFFAGIDPYWEKCVLGRVQTYSFVHRFRNALWLSDSLYNLSELGISEIPSRAVVPPFLAPIATRRIEPNQELLKQLVETSTVHLLMVGRFVPNKGHLLFLDVVRAYRARYGDGITGVVIGKLDPVCRDYYSRVMTEAEKAGLAGNLRFVGCVPDRDLLAYYLGCEAYVCCSGHEGFCVPVVEAQRTYLPVVARGAGAVRETLGPGQILLGDDPTEFADGIHRLLTDEWFWRDTVDQGWANFSNRFTAERIAADFTRALERYFGASL